jgi:hypothetical protein
MADNGKGKQPKKSRPKTKRPNERDWRGTPEYRLHCKRYGAFLKKHYPIDKIERLLEEIGI